MQGKFLFVCLFLIDAGASLVAQTVKISACNAGETGSIPGSGRSPGGENQLQCSCQRIPWTEEPGGDVKSHT